MRYFSGKERMQVRLFLNSYSVLKIEATTDCWQKGGEAEMREKNGIKLSHSCTKSCREGIEK